VALERASHEMPRWLQQWENWKLSNFKTKFRNAVKANDRAAIRRMITDDNVTMCFLIAIEEDNVDIARMIYEENSSKLKNAVVDKDTVRSASMRYMLQYRNFSV
jgi:hypothetical protein